MTFRWPTTGPALLIWSELVLAWVVALYYAGRTSSIWGRVQFDPEQSWWRLFRLRLAILLVAPFWIDGREFIRAFGVALLGVTLAVLLTLARERGKESWRRYGAEFEISATMTFVVISAFLMAGAEGRPLLPTLAVPLPENRTASLALAAATLGFTVRGGTQIVRAVLNKTSTLPKSHDQRPAESKVDEQEYNRGRLIGSIERVLLAGLSAVGAYAALGFTIAAKGLVRSKDFEDRDFAEYFLVGTLTSTAIALIAGALLRIMFVNLW